MSDSFRTSVVATAKRAIADREWPGLYAVSIECNWADYARAVRENEQLKVHFSVYYDARVHAVISDDLDAYLLSIVIDEACDYGRTGYASFALVGLDHPEPIGLRGEPIYLAPGITWRAA